MVLFSLFSMSKKKLKFTRLLLAVFIIGIYFGRVSINIGYYLIDSVYGNLIGLGLAVFVIIVFYLIVRNYQKQIWNKVEV